MTEARLYVRESRGRYTDRRWACVWLTQLVYFGLPWLRWDGLPAVWLDIPARRLVLFGTLWWPHDLVLLPALMLVAVLALFFAATLAGRVFCGYACPHSVYGEIFLWIERRIEGKPLARLRLDQAPLAAATLGKKVAKHAAWLAFAGWTGFTLAAYCTPAPLLLAGAAQGALGRWQLACMLAYAMLAYLNAGALRARFCRFICPWGRFQSLVIGPATRVIRYAAERGEPRALRNRKRLPPHAAPGDCIDCTLCVQVCPTGIDIRRGEAFDCIGCGACADACDQVMDKRGAPRGLIGYARAGPAPAGRARWRSGSAVAAALLGLAVLGFGVAASRRAPLKLALTHDRALALRTLDGGVVENVYRMHVINTDRRAHRYRIVVSGLDTLALDSPAQLDVEGGAGRVLPLRLQADGAAGRAGANRIVVELVALDQPGQRVRQDTVFFIGGWSDGSAFRRF